MSRVTHPASIGLPDLMLLRPLDVPQDQGDHDPDRVAEDPGLAGINEIVEFWSAAGQDLWYAKDEGFDVEFRERFLDVHFAAARRERDHWSTTARGSLALLLLLDQFPRNAFRDTAHMFATDSLALMFARRAVGSGQDTEIEEDLRTFLYLPFTHSENLADQDRSVDLREALGPKRARLAGVHRDIIRRFGRYPHRNAVLGRESSSEEEEFLASGGFAG